MFKKLIGKVVEVKRYKLRKEITVRGLLVEENESSIVLHDSNANEITVGLEDIISVNKLKSGM